MLFRILKSLFGAPSPKLSAKERSDMAHQLETVASGGDPEILTAGIGMIRLGSKELLPGWMRLFGRSPVYSVGIGASTIDGAFLFAPPGAPSQAMEFRTSLPLFTTRAMADECVATLPKLDSVIECTGLSALRFAVQRQLSISINILSDTCAVSIPKDGLHRFVTEIELLSQTDSSKGEQ